MLRRTRKLLRQLERWEEVRATSAWEQGCRREGEGKSAREGGMRPSE